MPTEGIGKTAPLGHVGGQRKPKSKKRHKTKEGENKINNSPDPLFPLMPNIFHTWWDTRV